MVVRCHFGFWPLGRVGFEPTLSDLSFFKKLVEFFYKFAENWSILKGGNLPAKWVIETPGRYESIATVGEIGVWWRANFQSGSRVLKKVFWTLSYLYLWHTMWFHAKKLLKTLKFWKSLNSKFFTLRPTARKRREPCWHEITLYAIDIDKERFRTPFLTL